MHHNEQPTSAEASSINNSASRSPLVKVNSSNRDKARDSPCERYARQREYFTFCCSHRPTDPYRGL